MTEANNSAKNNEAHSAPVRVKRAVETRACGYLRRSRSVRLIERLLATGTVERDDLACALSVTLPVLESYRRGHARMPLERQLSLALLVIERWPCTPQLRRYAFALRGQVFAEAAFDARITKTHVAPRVTAWVQLTGQSSGATRRPRSD